VAWVAVQLLARSIRRAGCLTRGPGPPCWACWKSEKCAHLARFGFFCSGPACMTCGTQPPRRRGRTLERVGEDSAHDG
jgi:hypothetical protein